MYEEVLSGKAHASLKFIKRWQEQQEQRKKEKEDAAIGGGNNSDNGNGRNHQL